jgi:galactokinase
MPESGYEAGVSSVARVVAFGPGRVNLIGEHTDYNGGFVLPTAIPQQTRVEVCRRLDRRVEVSSQQAPEPAFYFLGDERQRGDWLDYVQGLTWALRQAGMALDAGFDLAISSDVPLGAGLSSSHALECAVLTALADLGGLEIAVEERPKLVQRSENIYVGAPTGIMDQSASLRCTADHALFLDCRSYAVEQIPFDLAAAGLAILIINSNAPHHHSDGEYGARRRSCEEAARILGVPALRDVPSDGLEAALARLDDPVMRRRVRHVVTEDQRVLDTVELLKAGRIREIGPLLTASHASMRDDFEITVDQVDVAVEAALGAGAYGARMTGGGFGGCVVALIDADRATATTEAVAAAYAARGFTPATTWTAVAGPGASKL